MNCSQRFLDPALRSKCRGNTHSAAGFRPLWVTLLRDVRRSVDFSARMSVLKGTVLGTGIQQRRPTAGSLCGDNIDHEAAEGLVDSADVAPLGREMANGEKGNSAQIDS